MCQSDARTGVKRILEQGPRPCVNETVEHGLNGCLNKGPEHVSVRHKNMGPRNGLTGVRQTLQHGIPGH